MDRTLVIALGLVGIIAPLSIAQPQPAPCHGHPALFMKSDSFPPPASHDRGYDVLSYDLDLELNPTTARIAGRVAIGLVALQAGQELVHLDLVPEMVCSEILSSTGNATFTQTHDSLLVTLDVPLSTVEPETLTLVYEGIPPRHGSFRAGLMFRKHDAGTRLDPSDDVPAIANVSETWSAHSWWPCKDHPHDKALVTLAATVPDTLPLVSNGVLEGIDDLGDGRRRYRWREDYPMPTYLVSLAASNYLSWRKDCEVNDALGGHATIDLGFHVFPHDFQDAQTDLAVTCAAFQFLTALLGPYPFAGEKYDQAEIKWAGAMEHPTASSMPTFMFTGEAAYDGLVVHELAHQWFGNSLTLDSWQEIWLNEGFARYCEALWVEHAQGRSSYLDFMKSIGAANHPELFVGDGLLGDPDPILPNFLVYDKGAWLLHSLRLLLGDDVFFQLLLDYANDPALVHHTVGTSDFRAQAERAAGRSLERFFRIWLETEIIPEIHADVDIGGRTGNVRIQLRQLQEEWLEMAVPVVLHCGQAANEINLILDQRVKDFSLAVNCPVDSVSVDPHGAVLMRRADTPAPLLEISRPWPNPSRTEGPTFAIRLREPTDLSVRVYDARGRRVAGARTETLSATEADQEAHRWTWQPDLSLAAGVYWLEFQGLGRRVVKKVTYLK